MTLPIHSEIVATPRLPPEEPSRVLVISSMAISTLLFLGSLAASALLFPHLGYAVIGIAAAGVLLETAVVSALLYKASRYQRKLADFPIDQACKEEEELFKGQLQEKDRSLPGRIELATLAKQRELRAKESEPVDALQKAIEEREAATKRLSREAATWLQQAQKEAFKILDVAEREAVKKEDDTLREVSKQTISTVLQIVELKKRYREIQTTNQRLRAETLGSKDPLREAFLGATDVVLRCADGEIKTHSAFLYARSQLFRDGSTRSGFLKPALSDGHIEFTDLQEFEVEEVQLFIDAITGAKAGYVYPKNDMNGLLSLWKIADKLGCKELADAILPHLGAFIDDTDTAFECIEKLPLIGPCIQAAENVIADHFEELLREALLERPENHPLWKLPLEIVAHLLGREEIRITSESQLLDFLTSYAMRSCDQNEEAARDFLEGKHEKNKVNLLRLIRSETFSVKEVSEQTKWIGPIRSHALLDYFFRCNSHYLIEAIRKPRASIERGWWRVVRDGTCSVVVDFACLHIPLRNRLLLGPLTLSLPVFQGSLTLEMREGDLYTSLRKKEPLPHTRFSASVTYYGSMYEKKKTLVAENAYEYRSTEGYIYYDQYNPTLEWMKIKVVFNE